MGGWVWGGGFGVVGWGGGGGVVVGFTGALKRLTQTSAFTITEGLLTTHKGMCALMMLSSFYGTGI